jgi:hypothetical protein
VTLINDVLTLPGCATETSTTPTGSGSETSTTTSTSGGAAPTTSTVANGGAGTKKKPKGKSTKPSAAKTGGSATLVRGKNTASGVSASVQGRRINTVTFTDNGVRVGAGGSRTVHVAMTPGVHRVVAHVTFNGGTKSKTLAFSFRVPTPVLHPKFGPSQFTG